MDASILIRLIDQASGPAAKIATGLRGIGSAVGQMKQGFGDAIRQGFSVENVEAATKNAEAALDRARGRLLGAFGMAMTLAVPVMKSAEFDQSMRGLDKVLDVTQSRLEQLRKFALDTSTTVPIAASGLIDLMTEAAQGGIPQDEIERFATYVAKAAVAFDMAGGAIGERFAKLRNVYTLNQEGIEALGDAMNHLSNKMASKASEISDFVERAAGTAKTLHLTSVQMAAVGSAMISAGIAPETAARGVAAFSNKLIAGGKNVDKAFKSLGMSRKQFMKDLETDAPAALEKLFTTMAKSPKGMEALIELVGQDFSDDFSKFLSNPELLAEAFRLVADGADYTGSASDEAGKQAEGAVKKWELLTNKLTRLAIVVGDTLLPTFLEITDRVGGAIDQFAAFSAANPELSGAIVKTVAAVLAMSIAWRLLAFGVAAVRLPLVSLASLFLKFDSSGRNIALGWRLLAGAGRALGTSASMAGRAVGGLIGRLGGLRNTLRAGAAAGWMIPLAFEFIDDMGRTPEQRLEQMRQAAANYKSFEQQVDQSSFGQWWQGIKDQANAAMGLDAGQSPAEALMAWMQRGWDRFDTFITTWGAELRTKASELPKQFKEGLSQTWTDATAWLEAQWASLSEQLKFNVLFDIDWPEPPEWLLWLMQKGRDAGASVRAGADRVTSWWNDEGSKKTEDFAQSVSGGQVAAPAGSGGAMSDIWSSIKSTLGLAGDDLAAGAQKGGQAVADGGRQAADALTAAAGEIRSAAASIQRAAASARAPGGNVGSAISNAKTGALHGGTE